MQGGREAMCRMPSRGNGALFRGAKTKEVGDLKIGQIGGQIGEAQQRQLPGVHARTIAKGHFRAKTVQIAGSPGTHYRNAQLPL
jgi:hypothetical protein